MLVPSRNASILAVASAFIAAFVALGIWLQSRVHLNHDVAWIVHSARWLLEGKRLGIDIVDVNPPLIWFLSLPAALMVKLGWLAEPTALRAWTWTLCLVSLWMSYRLLEPLRRAGRPLEAAAILVGAAFAMSVLPAGAFAQREHLAFIFAVPYGLLQAARLMGAPVAARLAVGVGVLAALGFGLKPWFLAVPLLLEIVLVVRSKSLRQVFRPETLALGATLVAYALALFLFAPAYLTEVLPMAMATYWAYDSSLPALVHLRKAFVPLLGALVLLALARRLPAQALALLAMFVGFAFSHWAQKKGFAYHAYPAMATAVTLFMLAAASLAQTLLEVELRARAWLKAALVSILPLLAAQYLWQWSKPTLAWLEDFDMAEGYIGAARTRLIARINTLLPTGGHVYGFSTHPYPAFPTMSYTRAEWASAYVGQFTLPAYVARKRVQDPARLAALDAAVQRQRADVLREMLGARPDLVLIESKPYRLGMRVRAFDDIAFYSEDPRFAEFWRQYQEIKGEDSIRIFQRKASPGDTPWKP